MLLKTVIFSFKNDNNRNDIILSNDEQRNEIFFFFFGFLAPITRANK